MSKAHDLFVAVPWMATGNQDAYERLCKAAQLWRADGEDFSAGMAVLRAAKAAWGYPQNYARSIGKLRFAILRRLWRKSLQIRHGRWRHCTKLNELWAKH